jgi:type IV pilus assembly protein PilX
MKLQRATSLRPAPRQRGIVLIITLVMLVIISLLATFTIRNTISTEAVSGNVRTTQLAHQAAETALRYCETAVASYVRAPVTPPNPVNKLGQDIVVDGQTLKILPQATPPRALTTGNWDKVTDEVLVLPESKVNLGAGTNYRRMPECMVEQVPVVPTGGTALSTTTTFLVTARGFGPEVAEDPLRGRPNGSEVWLQSTIELE